MTAELFLDIAFYAIAVVTIYAMMQWSKFFKKRRFRKFLLESSEKSVNLAKDQYKK